MVKIGCESCIAINVSVFFMLQLCMNLGRRYTHLSHFDLLLPIYLVWITLFYTHLFPYFILFLNGVITLQVAVKKLWLFENCRHTLEKRAHTHAVLWVRENPRWWLVREKDERKNKGRKIRNSRREKETICSLMAGPRVRVWWEKLIQWLYGIQFTSLVI